MLTNRPPHFLTGEELDRPSLLALLDKAEDFRINRSRPAGVADRPLVGKTIALLFEKPSLRTRVSFTVAIQELGGMTVESMTETSKKEEPEDVIRVLGGYVHGVMLRCHAQRQLERMASCSTIPIINGLSDDHHPCQALADLLTLRQHFGGLEGVELAYVGDGNNVLHSLLLLGPILGVHVRYACPKGYEPNALVVRSALKRSREGKGSIKACASPQEAARGANAIYTDVWTSMGFEVENGKKDRENAFRPYQVNAALYREATPGAILLHCLPMIRGHEITDEMADHPNSALIRQSENRLHAQKALLTWLMDRPRHCTSRGTSPGNSQ
jgi:ornithine carbamoyltransferase